MEQGKPDDGPDRGDQEAVRVHGGVDRVAGKGRVGEPGSCRSEPVHRHIRRSGSPLRPGKESITETDQQAIDDPRHDIQKPAPLWSSDEPTASAKSRAIASDPPV